MHTKNPCEQALAQTLYRNSGDVQVRDGCFDFSVEIGLNITSVQFNDKGKARRFLVDVLNRLRFPPSRHRVDGKEISARKIRSGATELINLQGADVTPFLAENPAVIVRDLSIVRLVR